MPRHSKTTHKFSLSVLHNKRADGKIQYKITLPKRLAAKAWASSEPVTGEIFLSRSHNSDAKDRLSCTIYMFRNESEEYQRELLNATWKPLMCPFCNEVAEPPLFPEGTDPISHKLTHSCGSIYYVDRSDTRSREEWNNIKGTGRSWIIVHNYHVQFGRTASNLHPDFDLID